MTLTAALATIAGGALFPFLIRIVWGKLVDDFGAIGGFMSAAFVVGVVWIINHGLADGGLIYQTGAWVDMAFAAGIGVLTADIARGNSFSGAVPKILAAICGGIIAGLILSFVL